MFTRFKSDLSQKSRIDLWLISDSLISYLTSAEISPSPLTDHAAIDITFSDGESKQRRKVSPGYWKLNCSFLLSESYCQQIREIAESVKSQANISATSKWEQFKYECRKFSVKFGKNRASVKNKEVTDLIRKMSQILKNPILGEDDKQSLYTLQSRLDDLFLEKARGAFIRSRAKWLEFGEKNSAYFFNLEKKRGSNKRISSLYINNSLSNDPSMISSYVSNFYQNLYTSSFDLVASSLFFRKVHSVIPKINDHNRELCEEPFTIDDLYNIVKRMPHNKSPGPDGLPFEFFKVFWDSIKCLLYEALVECINNGELAESMKQGLICLIPKPNKDPNILDNWRPITLLNSDYKLLASVYAEKLKSCLADIISNTQSGFLKGRHISNNIRLIIDILDYPEFINKDALILFIDFYKAFDTAEHSFIFEALYQFGFGTSFINAIRTLYNGINSCVSLASGTSPRFSVGRGIRQGCPISPFLFLLAAGLLSLHIKHSNIEGINIEGNTLIISQLADDTCLFLNNDSQVSVAFNEFILFSKASGLVVNPQKSEILYVHDSNKNSVDGILVKRHVKYLGVDICKSDADRLHHNFQPRLDNIKKILCCWLQRDLTIYGRVLLTKAEGILRLVYPAFSLYVDQKTIKMINSLLFRFIWKNKTEYVQRKSIIRNYKEGGLNALDFNIINQTFKINWIKNCLSNNELPWFWIPNLIFKRCGGLKFLLTCNFKSHLCYGCVNNYFPTLAVNGVYLFDKKCNNFFIRNALSSTPGCPSKAQSKWRICYPNSDLKNLWTFSHKLFIPSKIKELHFKIVHRYYPCNLFLSRFF
uniref:Reverse transcriptase domain-containing protein n=1 Tax=Cyprinus carpio carpio TaxID=630221 RepID=A0A9J8DK74_CYPCA